MPRGAPRDLYGRLYDHDADRRLCGAAGCGANGRADRRAGAGAGAGRAAAAGRYSLYCQPGACGGAAGGRGSIRANPLGIDQNTASYIATQPDNRSGLWFLASITISESAAPLNIPPTLSAASVQP